MEQIVASGRVERGRIGVTMQDINVHQANPIVGARVADISKGSSAERAGLRKGEIITAINERLSEVRRSCAIQSVWQKWVKQVRLQMRKRSHVNVTVDIAPAEPATTFSLGLRGFGH